MTRSVIVLQGLQALEPALQVFSERPHFALGDHGITEDDHRDDSDQEWLKDERDDGGSGFGGCEPFESEDFTDEEKGDHPPRNIPPEPLQEPQTPYLCFDGYADGLGGIRLGRT